MPSSEYTAVPSTGRLKLKGGPPVSGDSKVSKKKKKSKPKDSNATASEPEIQEGAVGGGSALSSALKDEDQELAAEDGGQGRETWKDRGKTEAERKWQEQRRKRLDERLKREGIKSHKERVEELNRYLSGLSEHHDMPKIGPG